MADALATAVSNVITRLLIMEPLCVPAAAYASKRWIEYRQDWPYWVNRISGMQRPAGPRDMTDYEMSVTMRLVLSYITAATREDVVSNTANVQDKAWEYVPTVVRYFEQYNLLNPPGYAPITHLSPAGVSISCPQGMSLITLPAVNDVFVSIDFDLTVPFEVGAD